METTEGETSLAKRFELESYEIDVTLSTGSFGYVWITKEKKTWLYVAFKILKKTKIINIKQKFLGVFCVIQNDLRFHETNC